MPTRASAAGRAAAPDPPPAPAPAAALVEGWPGPALLVTVGAGLTAASPQGRALVEADGPEAPWRTTLFAWLNGAARPADPAAPAGLAGRTAAPERHVSEIPDGAGPRLVDWTAVALPDNTVALLGRDVTLERAVHGALVESRRRLRDLVELAGDAAFETDAEGRFAWLSGDPVPGRPADTLVGAPVGDLLATADPARSPFETRRRVTGAAVTLADGRGRPVAATVTALPIAGPNGTWAGARGLIRLDTTDPAAAATVGAGR